MSSHQPTVLGAARSIEFFGLPGIGKSAAGQALMDRLIADRPGTRRRDVKYVRVTPALFALARHRSLATSARRITFAIIREADGDRRARVRRGWKVLKGLARLVAARTPGDPLILEEGPLNWLLALPWSDDHSRARLVSRILDYYAQVDCVVVVLRADDKVARERYLRRKAELDASKHTGWLRRPRAARQRVRSLWFGHLPRLNWWDRHAAFDDMVAEAIGHTGSDVHAIDLDAAWSPEDIADQVWRVLSAPNPSR